MSSTWKSANLISPHRKLSQRRQLKLYLNNKTRYTHALGLLELRQAICDFYFKEYGVNITPDQVMVSTGTSPALLFAMLAILDHGDEVIISNPRYPCYQNFILAAGGKIKEVKTYPEEGFQYRPKDIKKKLSPRTKAILINSPSNPTGIVMTQRTVAEHRAIRQAVYYLG